MQDSYKQAQIAEAVNTEHAPKLALGSGKISLLRGRGSERQGFGPFFFFSRVRYTGAIKWNVSLV